MATLKDTLKYAKQNPNDPRNAELFKAIKNGVFDQKASEEGIDISGLRGRQTQDNVGTGFQPTFEREKGDGFFTSAMKTVGNVPRSAFELGKNVVNAVKSPIETGKAVFGLAKGAGAKGGELLLEKTDIGQKLLEKVNQDRITNGMPELNRKNGVLQADETPELQTFNSVSKYFSDRYGSVEGFKDASVEDPVGVLADIAGALSGVGAVARGTSVGGKIAQVSRAIEPTAVAARAVSSVSKTVPRLGKIVSEVIPGFSEIRDKAITKALDFSQGDVGKFNVRRGTTPGDYITQKTVKVGDKDVPLLGKTVEETAQNITTLKNNSYTELRTRLGEVKQTYKAGEVPRVTQTLQSIADEIKDVPGLEGDMAEIQRLLAKDEYTLSDVQRAKEIFDERYNIFNKSGDPKAGDRAAGLKNVREEIKDFIEVEGDKFGIDVRQFNDDVSVAYELEKAIQRGATRDLTRNQIGLTDHIIGTGLGIGVLGGGISIPMAVGIFLSKRLLESSTFRLALAEGVSKLSDAKAAAIRIGLQTSKLSPELTNVLRKIVEEAKNSLPEIEVGSKIINQTNEEPSKQ